ncbi:RNA polymerase sigma factor [Marivirga lumbricoides]|uniref:RNA polymerase sigma factor n=1 Tax=Marivirga lumbricoides TaxID=1046115 RepID=A0ABQ1MI16_9BACT|nr:RNA polymerase sigma factor [Marivirga lumbricoides]
MFRKNHNNIIIDEVFFKKLHQLYSGMIYNYLYKLTANSYLSEEITQEAFIKLWNKRESLPEITNYKAYLFTIAKNLLLDAFKQEKKVKEASLQALPQDYHQNTPQLILEEYELEKVKTEAINGLKGITKEVFILSREKSLSYLEISKALGISKVAVKKQMMKALCAIRQKINPFVDIELIIYLLISFSFIK